MRNKTVTQTFMSMLCVAFIHPGVSGRTIQPSVTFHRAPECDHLKYDETQKNAYSSSSLGDGYCCLCPRGTKWVDDCHPDNHSSTNCQECEQNHYVDYEPHMLTECYPKHQRHCFSPRKYYKGTIKEKDRCVCPDGMYDDKSTGQCMSVNTKSPKVSEASTAEISTAVTTKETIDIPIEPPDVVTEKVKADVSTTVLVTTDSLQHLVSTVKGPMTDAETSPSAITNRKFTPTAEPAATVTERKSSDLTFRRNVALVAVGSIAAVVIVGVCIWKIVLRQRRTNNTDDYASSSSTAKLNEDYTGSMEMSGMEDAALQKNQRRPPTRNLRYEGIINEEKEVLLKALPIGCEYQDANRANTNRPNSIINNTNDILPRHRYEEFAKEVAERLGEVCDKNDILPLFRRIVGHKYSHRLNDISAAYTDRREMFYQCMLFAITLKGEDLSPSYILNEVRNCGMSRYSEIVESVLETFLRRSVAMSGLEIGQPSAYFNDGIQQPSSD